MIDNVIDLAVSRNSKRNLRITEELLLAPIYDDISKRNMLLIKEASFELLLSCNQSIFTTSLSFTSDLT